MDRLDSLDEMIDDASYQVQKLLDCGQPIIDESMKKIALEVRRAEILMMLDEYQRNL
tara:strand:- start:4432 stop:4602 length:171 start_codon:yes stop_codon:yes gene_type:complete